MKEYTVPKYAPKYLYLKIFWVTLSLYSLMTLGRYFLGLALIPFASDTLKISLTPGVLWRGVLAQGQSFPHVLSVVITVPIVLFLKHYYDRSTLRVSRFFIFIGSAVLVIAARFLLFSLFSQKLNWVDLNALFFGAVAFPLSLLVANLVNKYGGDLK